MAFRSLSLLATALACASTTAYAYSSAASRGSGDNGGIHLAIAPPCATSLSGTVSSANAGLDLASIKTIVAFGDSYSSALYANGSAQPPAVLGPPPAIEAGGRATDGKLWVEGLAGDIGAQLVDYAVSGAVTNLTLWPNNPTPNDFINQTNVFFTQNNTFDPATTLYSVFFGINDYEASLALSPAPANSTMLLAAQTLLALLAALSSAPTNARNFLVLDDYGRGTVAPQGEAWKTAVWSGLVDWQKNNPAIAFAYADLAPLWSAVLAPPPAPGYAAFGYANTSNCLGPDDLRADECDDPAGWFYWIVGHPSKETHRIMADYVEDVIANCTVS